MTIREKLLMKLAQDPKFEGSDDTEKSLVAELKAEMATAEESAPTAEKAEVKAAAADLVKSIKELLDASKAQSETKDAPVDRTPVQAGELDLSETGIKAMKKEVRFAEYAKALINKDFTTVKALAEGTDGQGGYLVPDDFRAELIEHLGRSASFRAMATVIPMESKLFEAPSLTADVAVYWGSENTAISTTSADFGNFQLTPFRLNAIIYASRELFADSAISIMEILQRRFRIKVGQQENKVFLAGSGSGQPTGLNSATLRSLSAGSALNPDHLTQAYYLLPEDYREQATWLINSRAMVALENAKDSNGAYLYPSLREEVKSLKGRPVFVNDNQPSATIIFGDISWYWIGDRQQVTMEATTEGGNTWEKHQVGLKLIERVDGKTALTTAFVKITSTGIS